MSDPIISREDWRRLEPLVDAVLDAPRARRGALIAELTGGDTARRAELERLVAECERDYPLLDAPAAERFASVLAEETPLPETIAGRYRIVREAGRGGMAIVWLAHDLKHGRDVAIKVVRPELAAAIGRERFLREIEIAARLRHPLIVPLYDSGEVAAGQGESLLYYVMPYEAGQSLRTLLERDGPLPAAEVVRILRDLCEALAYAHGQGIVHLDIKPDNVMLSGGHALITDFGIARAASAVDGTTAGTPTYMAPEQRVPDARVDHRADIWASGALAYELLVGRPPSPGAPAPPALGGIIAKCLEEDPADRWQSADELLAALDSIAVPEPPRRRRRRRRVLALLGAAAVVTSGAVALVRARERGDRAAAAALTIGRAVRLTSEPGLEVQPSISPDGRRVAYAAGRSQQMHIFVRPTSGGAAIRLTTDSTGNEWFPRWSPDGTRVLFLARGGVFSAAATGGAPAREEVAARASAIVTSAAWSPDGREIAYVRGDSLLARASGMGRARLIATSRDLHSCAWSPDGARIACVSGNGFYVTVGATAGAGPMFGNLAPSSIVLVSALGGSAESVTDGGSLHQSPAWSRDARTLYFVSNREGPRDVYALDVSPRAPRDRKPVRVTTGMEAQSIDLSRDGARVVYAVYASSANVWAMPIPARGSAPATASAAVQITTDNQTVEGVRVSRDGRWLVYDSDLGGSSDVYRIPIRVPFAGGEPERLTHGSADEFRGALSPDGRELAYHTFEGGARSLFVMPLGGSAARQLTRPPGQGSMANWSPDGSALTFFDIAATKVLVVRRDAGGRWGVPRFTGGRGWRPEWSPDGRTIAYVSPADGHIGVVSADSGAPREVYVPDSGGPSAELAIFSADGREVYFKSHDPRGRASFWSIPASGGRPRLLARFDDPARASNRFEFASDGRRFYFTVEARESDIWVAEVVRR
ncbi:MAG TPA: protein kinase [Gemmatimonadaceae bacterium]|nr:protein kinase [Gemmatimonadaceae bacterium]